MTITLREAFMLLAAREPVAGEAAPPRAAKASQDVEPSTPARRTISSPATGRALRSSTQAWGASWQGSSPTIAGPCRRMWPRPTRRSSGRAVRQPGPEEEGAVGGGGGDCSCGVAGAVELLSRMSGPLPESGWLTPVRLRITGGSLLGSLDPTRFATAEESEAGATPEGAK